MKKQFFVVAFLLFPILLMAQKPKEERFSVSNAEEFSKQLKKFMTENKLEQNKQMMDEWEKSVEKNNGLSQPQLLEVAANCNFMLDTKYRVPQFDKYVEAILAYTAQKGDAGLFSKWNAMIPDVIKMPKNGSVKDYMTFMDFSKAYFSKNIFKENGDRKWFCESEGFELEFTKEPQLTYTKCNFVITGSGDTIRVKNTSGAWLICKEKWVGKSGTTDWSKAGLSTDSVYATYGKYSIDAVKSELNIDSAILIHKQYLNAPLAGKLIDKLNTRKPGSFSGSYPRFTSSGYFELKDLAKGVKYKGGFGVSGYNVIGTGVNGKFAEIKFYNNKNQLVAVTNSNQFFIKKGIEILSTNAVSKIYEGESDSISHPGCEMSFSIPTRTLKLQRGEMGIAKIVFNDSYHQCELSAEAIIWPIDSTKIKMVQITAAGKVPSTFESFNHYEENKLEKYTNVADFNPIDVIRNYCEKNKVNQVDADVIAKMMSAQYDESVMKRTYYNLTEEGFIFYDEAHHLVFLKDKAIMYSRAKRKLIDFDNIKITSQNSSGKAAEISLVDRNISIEGVKSFNLSDSNLVTIFPSKGKLVMKKNRDMDFAGGMFAGRLDFKGKDLSFDYKAFKVGLKKMDSMLINIPTGKMQQNGNEELIPTKTYICGLNGDMMIDGPFNKSHRTPLPAYPKLFSTSTSYAYYDDEKNHHHAYDKKRFYFQLDTFRMDSLNTFLVSNIHFPGKLVSGGIFPEFDEQLKLQKDLSLGFQSKTPDDGFPVYKDKGAYKGSISLTNAGLQGDGEFGFIANKQMSKNIFFTPDSLNAKVEIFTQFATTSPVPFPETFNKNVRTHWMPYADRMEVKMDTTPFDMFGNLAKLKGNVIISSKGMQGNGILDWKEANMHSKVMKFGKMNAEADTSDIKIKTSDGNIAVTSPNVHANIDFEKRIGDFASNDNSISATYVYNQYTTSINKFHWDMDKKIIDFVSPAGKIAQFNSLNPDQKNLSFVGKSAQYNLSNFELSVKGIQYINAGDALITPDSGVVYIEPKAEMKLLQHAKIICDSAKQYHKIYDATVKIFSKDNYLATNAKYDFFSKITGKQVLQVDTLTMGERKGKIISMGFANIKEENNFALNQKMNFKGYFRFNAKQRNPSLDGFARLKLKSTTIPTEWFTMNSVIKADSGTFDVENAKNEKGDRVFFGILRSTFDSIGVYPAIFSSASTATDIPIIVPEGTLEYNLQTNDLTYGLGTKIRGESNKGDFVRYNDNTNKLYCDGKFNLGYNFQGMQVAASGNATYDMNKNSVLMNACIGLKIDFSNDLYAMMVKELMDNTNEKENIDFGKKLGFYEKAFSEFVSAHDVKKAFKPFKDLTEMPVDGPPKIDFQKKSPFNILFTDVKLQYDPFTDSWKASCPVGLINVGDYYFGKKIYAYMEFGGKKGDDFFNIMFETSEVDWYCMMYRGHILQLMSSNDAFNEAINKIVPEKRKVTLDAAKPTQFYQYQIGSDSRVKQFKINMKMMRY